MPRYPTGQFPSKRDSVQIAPTPGNYHAKSQLHSKYCSQGRRHWSQGLRRSTLEAAACHDSNKHEEAQVSSKSAMTCCDMARKQSATACACSDK